MTNRNSVWIGALVAIGGLLAGCAGASTPSGGSAAGTGTPGLPTSAPAAGTSVSSTAATTAATAPAHALEDTRWQLTTIVTGGAASDVPTGVDPAVTISAGRIVIDAQCNSVRGAVSVTGDTLVVSQVISTLMACPGPRGTMEKLLTTAIAGTVSYAINGDQLSIISADGTELQFVPSKPSHLPSGSATAPDRSIQDEPSTTLGPG